MKEVEVWGQGGMVFYFRFIIYYFVVAGKLFNFI